jgi:type II secretory pathway component PulF
MQDFFRNVSRYPRFLISFTLGIFYVALSPLFPLFKRPSTAIATISFLVAAFVFLAFTLRAMLGLDVYQPQVSATGLSLLS